MTSSRCPGDLRTDRRSIPKAKAATSWGRREFLGHLGKGLAAAAFITPVSWEASRSIILPSTSRRPNFVLILADDMGYADFGLQGCTDIPTPHIDSLGANGVRLTNGYVSCPICAPTRAGLMTGRYPQRYGFETNPGPEDYADEKFGLPGSETTLAERLKAAGYATGMFGKWHLGYKSEQQPTARGFDEFFGFLSGANSYLPGAGRGGSRNPILRGERPVDEEAYLTDALGREAVAFIDKHRAEPFFLYLPFNAVHAPLEASEEYLRRFAAIQDSRRRTFAAMLSAMDENIGRVLQALRRHRLEESTLIVFLSDNGGPTPQTTASNLPLRGTKGQVLEGGIRVPFLVQWKGHLPAGKVDHRAVIQLDIVPTVLAAAGTGSPSPAAVGPEKGASPSLDGVDLLPYLSGEKSGPPHDALFWRFNDQQAVRSGDWKLVRARPDPKPRLYNLANDISEATDLADKEPVKVKELSDVWSAWNAQLMAPQWQREDARTRGRAEDAGLSARTQVSLEERFKQYDRNGDGKLTPEEFPRASTFKQIDKNNDGVVTLDEARAFFRGRRRLGEK